MAVSQRDLESFTQFALERLNSGESESLEHLLDLWKAQHPDGDELHESLASFRRGLVDIDEGRVHPAEEVIAELRRGLPDNHKE